jgi:hypothetical protein
MDVPFDDRKFQKNVGLPNYVKAFLNWLIQTSHRFVRRKLLGNLKAVSTWSRCFSQTIASVPRFFTRPDVMLANRKMRMIRCMETRPIVAKIPFQACPKQSIQLGHQNMQIYVLAGSGQAQVIQLPSRKDNWCCVCVLPCCGTA